MAVVAHFYPNFETQLGAKAVNLSTDTLTVGLIASGTFTWGATPEGYTYVSQFLAGDGTHGALTEVVGGGYSRQNLTSVSYSASGEVVTLTSASPAWATATFSTVYGFLYDSSVGANDAAHPILLYWDFGGAQSVTSTTFTLAVGAAGLCAWTASLWMTPRGNWLSVAILTSPPRSWRICTASANPSPSTPHPWLRTASSTSWTRAGGPAN